MSGLFNFLAAIIGWFVGRKPKVTVTEIAQHDASIAEKQAEILADHTRPDVADRLRAGDF